MQRSNLFKFSTNITSNMSDDVQLRLNLAVSIKNDDHSYSCHCERTFFVINIHRPVDYDTICASPIAALSKMCVGNQNSH